ncbi:nucleotidyltransferase [Caloranaerobacter azorensis H53214]|uniref:Nucleotidyltransferase n=1 Tax=Caloranaerobacter azorensis H53214 TaxID=1156417 RepID=A0A096BF37_9FIRM|nr:nucleotidyltransferase family protein [Caloranaerobacter azorensis]KGG79472.1 nucleotidyltransferase [Caloranaerobacter azorensis H53214]
MVSKAIIEKKLKSNKEYLIEKYHVKRIGIFGSYARGEQTECSDVDILVEFSRPIGWEFIDLKYYLEDLLNMKVDLVTVNALKPQIKDKILKEVVYQ